MSNSCTADMIIH